MISGEIVHYQSMFICQCKNRAIELLIFPTSPGDPIKKIKEISNFKRFWNV